MLWKMGIMEDVTKGSDGHARAAVVRIPKSNSLIKRPMNIFFILLNISTNVEQEPTTSTTSRSHYWLIEMKIYEGLI